MAALYQKYSKHELSRYLEDTRINVHTTLLSYSTAHLCSCLIQTQLSDFDLVHAVKSVTEN
jgi:hypothetical protein